MLEEANLSVGQVAKRCGVKVSTLHFYESLGLIKSLRNQGNQRRYMREVLRRISVIKAAFANLPDNRTPTKDDWQQLSRYWQKGLNQKIAYLEKLRDSLDGCIGCGCLSMKNCPIYNPEDKLGDNDSGAVLLERSATE